MAPGKQNAGVDFGAVGRQADTIEVKISHRIIQLFSEGLYSSPHKAVEELVSNSFDANAENVHVILSPDLRESDATIAVLDDGDGMDVAELKEHWIIGKRRRRPGASVRGRKPIGKFGIGKLATYVLGRRLTHICKSNGKYYSATMNYSELESPDAKAHASEEQGVFNDDRISIPLRELTQSDAKRVLERWTTGSKPGYKALRLFGRGAQDTWTVAVMSGLTDMGKKLRGGRLNWVLRTAMPLRDDFSLYLDGDLVKPSKIDRSLIQKWVIGKDILQLGEGGPDGLEMTEDESALAKHRFGLSHEELGRITGYVELYEDELPGGKSDRTERSNGFFVYVRERMINIDDPGFGIERNRLRHGTFARLRVVVHIDSLDEALRSSRESLKQGNLYKLAQRFLHAVFNLARNRLVEHEKSRMPGALIGARISSAPGSLTRKPLLSLAERAIAGEAAPFLTRIPAGLSVDQKAELIESIRSRSVSDDGPIQSSRMEELDGKQGLAVYDIESGALLINISHPFIASFHDELTRADTRLPLEMLIVSEILLEAHLYNLGLDETMIREILTRRDELFRQLVRSTGRRNSSMIALALLDAREDKVGLEIEMRAAFEALGFENVVKPHIKGVRGGPDGTAETYLPATEDGKIQRYKVGLEAKSGGKVSAKRIGVAGIARHMRRFNCDHHLIVGNEFETSSGDKSATVDEIKEEKKKTKKTITLMHIEDLARLVRLVPAKRIGLSRLRGLFETCITPEESRQWVDTIAMEEPEHWPYQEILEAIWQLGNASPSEAIEYAEVRNELRHRAVPVDLSKEDVKECCEALERMARGVVYARDKTVEIDRRPDLILQDVRAAVGDYPENEQATIKI